MKCAACADPKNSFALQCATAETNKLYWADASTEEMTVSLGGGLMCRLYEHPSRFSYCTRWCSPTGDPSSRLLSLSVGIHLGSSHPLCLPADNQKLWDCWRSTGLWEPIFRLLFYRSAVRFFVSLPCWELDHNCFRSCDPVRSASSLCWEVASFLHLQSLTGPAVSTNFRSSRQLLMYYTRYLGPWNQPDFFVLHGSVCRLLKVIVGHNSVGRPLWQANMSCQADCKFHITAEH